MGDQTNAESLSPPPNDVGDLFDYDIGLDDILPQTTTQTQTAPNAQKPSAADGSGLGLDEEVKVTKSRAPVAKLDENRLLSQPGIPKLRRAAKTKLKFKGKGHEFSDAARLLNFYQLWLDDLFPKAKFADGLTMIEKLGHSRRIQTMRKQWIDEEKPTAREDEPDTSRLQDLERANPDDPRTDLDADAGVNPERPQQSPNDGSFPSGTARAPLEDQTTPRPQFPDDGDDKGLFLPDENSNPRDQDPEGGDIPEDDELDDLLKEQEEAAGLT